MTHNFSFWSLMAMKFSTLIKHSMSFNLQVTDHTLLPYWEMTYYVTECSFSPHAMCLQARSHILPTESSVPQGSILHYWLSELIHAVKNSNLPLPVKSHMDSTSPPWSWKVERSHQLMSFTVVTVPNYISKV